jgi:hypothetical protein
VIGGEFFAAFITPPRKNGRWTICAPVRSTRAASCVSAMYENGLT